MFKTRLLSGIVLVILALVFIITGNDLLLAVTGIISLIGLYELYRVFKIEKSCAGVVGGLATIVYYCNLKFQFIPDMMLFVIALLVVLMFVYVFSYPKYHTEQMLAAFFGVFYVSVMLSYVYQTRMLPGGAYIVNHRQEIIRSTWVRHAEQTVIQTDFNRQRMCRAHPVNNTFDFTTICRIFA